MIETDSESQNEGEGKKPTYPADAAKISWRLALVKVERMIEKSRVKIRMITMESGLVMRLPVIESR